jgi:hypothetical protein
MGRGDVVSIPPLVTDVGRGYVDGLLEEGSVGEGAGRPSCPEGAPHTPCCCDDGCLTRLSPV